MPNEFSNNVQSISVQDIGKCWQKLLDSADTQWMETAWIGPSYMGSDTCTDFITDTNSRVLPPELLLIYAVHHD